MIENGGIVDIIVLLIFLNLVGFGNDFILILLGSIDLFEGSVVLLIVVDSVGNM